MSNLRSNLSSFKWTLTGDIDLPILDLPLMTVSNGGGELEGDSGSKPEGDADSKLDGH